MHLNLIYRLFEANNKQADAQLTSFGPKAAVSLGGGCRSRVRLLLSSWRRFLSSSPPTLMCVCQCERLLGPCLGESINVAQTAGQHLCSELRSL